MIYTRKNRGQTIVIGSLLLIGLAVAFLVFLQISLFPDINQSRELESQRNAVESMIDLRSNIQLSTSSGSPQTVDFNNRVSYPLQPAAPPEQSGQISTVSGDLEIKNANYTSGNRFQEVDYNDATSTVIYNPTYIEISDEERQIIMDNTMIREYTPGNPINHTKQSIVSGDQITLSAIKTGNIDGIKSPNTIAISINPEETIDTEITNNDNKGNIKLVMNTNKESINNTMWEDQENIDDANLVDGNIELELSDTTYDLKFAESKLQF